MRKGRGHRGNRAGCGLVKLVLVEGMDKMGNQIALTTAQRTTLARLPSGKPPPAGRWQSQGRFGVVAQTLYGLQNGDLVFVDDSVLAALNREWPELGLCDVARSDPNAYQALGYATG